MAAITTQNTMAKPAPLSGSVSSTRPVSVDTRLNSHVSGLPDTVELASTCKSAAAAGFVMVFCVVDRRHPWNLVLVFGLPSSELAYLIGSIIGVGLMNQLMAANPSGTSGVDWSQSHEIGETLLISPLIGFSAAFLLLSILGRRSRSLLCTRPRAITAAFLDSRPA